MYSLFLIPSRLFINSHLTPQTPSHEGEGEVRRGAEAPLKRPAFYKKILLNDLFQIGLTILLVVCYIKSF